MEALRAADTSVNLPDHTAYEPSTLHNVYFLILHLFKYIVIMLQYLSIRFLYVTGKQANAYAETERHHMSERNPH
jgi:hypothetical protein